MTSRGQSLYWPLFAGRERLKRLQLRVDDIKEQGLLLNYCEPSESFPALDELQQSGEVRFDGPVVVSGRVQRIAGLVEVEGEVRVEARMACGRCLEDLSLPLDARFCLTFSRELPEIVDEEDGAEVELSAEEMGLIPFSGDEIDLREAIQEQVVMALPLRPLCRTECRGLCPQCGADLNRETCSCEAPVFNNRFGTLRELKINPEKNGSGRS